MRRHHRRFGREGRWRQALSLSDGDLQSFYFVGVVSEPPLQRERKGLLVSTFPSERSSAGDA